MNIRLLVLLFCAVLLSTTVCGLTASIGNARMIIHTDAPTVIQKSIKVNNVNDIAVDVTLTAAADIEDFTQVLDSTLTLQPGESRDARFTVNLEYGGSYEGKILVSFKPTDPDIKASPVGLASTVIILASGPENPNPPVKEEPQIEPEEPIFEPEEPQLEPEEPTEEPTQQPTTTTQPTSQPVKPKANPLVGIVIIVIVLVIGAALYWWYMRR